MGPRGLCNVQVGWHRSAVSEQHLTLSSNGCGLDYGVKNDRVVGVRGRAADRVNKGRLGPKGMYS
jgi:hypothetical protein